MVHHDYPHGSSRFASGEEIAQARLLSREGPQFGYWENQPLRIASDAPVLITGGAGSGKLTTLIAYLACDTAMSRLLYFDPRGEISAISNLKLIPDYKWNPTGLLGPQHRCNPLDVLKPDSESLTSDSKFLARNLIPLRDGGHDSYFAIRAQDWVSGFMKALVLRDGVTDLPTLSIHLSAIETQDGRWADLAQVHAGNG